MRQWSFSSLSTYEQCPAKYSFEKLSDWPKPPSGKAAARGTRVHEQLEAYLLGNRSDIPKEALTFSDEISALTDREPIAELEAAFDETWHQTDWDSSWARGKLDVVIPEMGMCIDWKTGRYYPKHRDQAELYALFLNKLGIHDDDFITVEFFYLDLDDVVTWEFKASNMQGVQDSWELRARKLDEETEWEAKPSQACRWCGYRAICPGYDEAYG